MQIFPATSTHSGNSIKFGHNLSAPEIKEKLAELYQTDRAALGELLSAALDPGQYIFSDLDVIRRLTQANLLTPDSSVPPQVREQVLAGYSFD